MQNLPSWLPLAFVVGLVPTAGCPFLRAGGSGGGGLVARTVAFPTPGTTSPKGLALLPIQVVSNGRPLSIPEDAQLAIVYRDSRGAVVKTEGVDNDVPAIALLLDPGTYTITGFDAVATVCPDGSLSR